MAQDLTAILQEQGQIDLAECFMDGSFGEANKGATMSGGARMAQARP
jgi:hypothetical protein